MTTPQVAIVTGGSSGVGQALTLLLAERGYTVVAVGRSIDKLNATVSLARAEHPEAVVLPFAGDITQPEVCTRIIEFTLQQHHCLDALVNCAGYAPLSKVEGITPEEWRAVIDINLSAAVYLTAAAWPTFLQQRSGVVVNFSSVASVDPFPGFAMYAPAKAAVNMFTHCLAQEGDKHGIRAVTLAPGAIETPMLRANFSEKVIPRHKTLDPVEVAAVACSCITGERAFDNGQLVMLPSP